MRKRQQANKVGVFLGGYDFGARVPRQTSLQDVAHIRIGMHRQDNHCVLPLENLQQRIRDPIHSTAKVFAPMRGHQNDSPVSLTPFEVIPAAGKRRIGFDQFLGSQ